MTAATRSAPRKRYDEGEDEEPDAHVTTLASGYPRSPSDMPKISSAACR